MTFRGSDGITTRMVFGYNPCKNNKKESKTYYQQNRRYLILREKDTSCPRVRFQRDLVKQLQAWRDSGDRLIVGLDANQNIYKGSIGKALTDPVGLDMNEVVGTFTGNKIGTTYFRGNRPIDGIWATKDVEVVGACVMPAGYGVGDHRLFVVDVLTTSIVGYTPPKIVRSSARRLNTKIPGALRRYNSALEKNVIAHRLTDKLIDAARSPTQELVKLKMDKVDYDANQYMAHAESKCRRIKSGRIPFSPESSVWIRRVQVYKSLLCYHAGKLRNKSNLKRAAQRCGIRHPLHISIRALYEHLKKARSKCKYFEMHDKRHRREHLHNRLKKARRHHDDEAATRILAILHREKDKSYWRRLNWSMAKQKSRSARVVQIERKDGSTVNLEGQQNVETAMFDRIHNSRFYLAEQAPICQGTLRGEFGYLANTKAGQAILDGTYEYSPDFNPGTRELLEECTYIKKLHQARDDQRPYLPPRMATWMAHQERIHLLLNIRLPLWPLYRRVPVPNSSKLPCPQTHHRTQAWHLPRSLD